MIDIFAFVSNANLATHFKISKLSNIVQMLNNSDLFVNSNNHKKNHIFKCHRKIINLQMPLMRSPISWFCSSLAQPSVMSWLWRSVKLSRYEKGRAMNMLRVGLEIFIGRLPSDLFPINHINSFFFLEGNIGSSLPTYKLLGHQTKTFQKKRRCLGSKNKER